jgi:hypothetical protein
MLERAVGVTRPPHLVGSFAEGGQRVRRTVSNEVRHCSPGRTRPDVR